jgi:hypothetical protein
MPVDSPVLSFGLPDGRLELRRGELDRWAEHLTWCYRLSGAQPQATIGVVDFGASPVAFLGSRLLMPTLELGVAERLPGRIICLDASRERVALVPGILSQVSLDVLVVRQDVTPALLAYCRKAEVSLDDILVITTFAFGARDAARRMPFRRGRRLLLEPSSVLMAPECAACGALHLRDCQYEVGRSGEWVATRGTSMRRKLPETLLAKSRGCPAGKDDWLIALPT